MNQNYVTEITNWKISHAAFLSRWSEYLANTEKGVFGHDGYEVDVDSPSSRCAMSTQQQYRQLNTDTGRS